MGQVCRGTVDDVECHFRSVLVVPLRVSWFAVRAAASSLLSRASLVRLAPNEHNSPHD